MARVMTRREAGRSNQLNDSDVSAMNTYPLLDNATDATDRCRSCGCAPTRRLFKRRNYCGKCFYLFECLKAVERWDLSKPETLTSIEAAIVLTFAWIIASSVVSESASRFVGNQRSGMP